MPKTHRDKLKQKLAQAMNHLRSAREDVGAVWTAFDGVHDDEAASLLLLGQAIELTEQGIVKFWEWAWGKVPENIDSYRR